MATENVNTRLLVLSWGYWFSSRTLGLLEHPYVTMRAICRDKFMRPLVIVPVVLWVMSWCLGVVLTRVGMRLSLGDYPWALGLGRALLFVWLWGSVFVTIWQVLLGYLWWRFRRLWE